MKNSPTYILGISESHTATAALLKDGEIIACASEERFTKKKLQTGIPKKAIEYCLDFAKITADELAIVACADIMPMFPAKSDYPLASISTISKLTQILLTLEEQIEKLIPGSANFFYGIYKFMMKSKIPKLQSIRLKKLQQIINLPEEKFIFLNHHICHASSALFSSSLANSGQPVMVFTADGVGDFESATVSKFTGSRLKKLVSINSQQSLGFFYMHITQLLGLKPVEDEYKIMGLAPYAEKEKGAAVYQLLKPFFQITSQPYWKLMLSEIHLYRKLPKLLASRRFDHIAWAAQNLLEEILTSWVQNAISKYKTSYLAFSGGVFANVKVNQKLASLKNLKGAFFMPSPGDESNAIGAAYYSYFTLTKSQPAALTSLYLGPSFTEVEIQAVFKNENRKFTITKPNDINLKVAQLLASGEVVARFAGRMEFGQRALGNRSILARPDNLSVVSFINSAIKQRDFWMPFAPTILRERAKDYLIMHKADSPFMNVTFDTTDRGKRNLAGAIHPYDKTTRPQILDRQTNPKYNDLIRKFENLTGIGAVLNTSFNLHSEPIVCTPQDAINTFAKSKLKYLALENFLISKN